MLVLRIVGYLGNHHWTSYLKCKPLGLILGFLIQEVRGFMKSPPGCCLGSPHSYYRSTAPSLEHHSDYPQMNVLSGGRGSLRHHLPCTLQAFQLWCLNHSHRRRQFWPLHPGSICRQPPGCLESSEPPTPWLLSFPQRLEPTALKGLSRVSCKARWASLVSVIHSLSLLW